MSYQDNDPTITLFQSEPGKPMEVMPSPDISRNIVMRGLTLTSMGINPLVDPFSWLIACLSCLSCVQELDDPLAFRDQVAREIRKGERKLNEMEVDKATILVVRYCLCSALDEMVLSQKWGANSNWSQHTLLTEFHNETAGGDKFFIILERLKSDPLKYQNLIEFLYLLLQMGFKGKFGRDRQGGQNELTEIGHDIYRLIRDARLSKQEKRTLVNLQTKYIKKPLKKVISPKLTLFITFISLATMYFSARFIIESHYQHLLSLYP